MRALLAGLTGLVAAAFLVLVMPAAAASAHDYPVSSTPATDATVTTADAPVSITYDAIVLNPGRGSTALEVLGPGKATRHFETTCATVTNATIATTAKLGEAGSYTVLWRVVSADGHPVSGSYTFRYEPVAGQPVSTGSAAGPDCGIKQTSTTTTTGGGVPVAAIVAGIAGALVLLVVVVVVIVLRASRPDRA